MKKIKSFVHLNTWKEGHQLVLMIYKTTDKFPQKELYSLVNQIRRAVVSVTSNIAEGFSRRTKKEKVRFYIIAKGSLIEVQNQLLIARDVGYIQSKKFKAAAEQTVIVHKLINGLIKSAKTHTKY